MWKKITLIFLLSITLIFGAAAGYAFYLYQQAEQSMEQMNENFSAESEQQSTPEESESFSVEQEDVENDLTQADSVSFLLIGIGDRPDDPGRADVIMPVSVNQADESVVMLNIPRDTRVDIPGRNQPDKINHTYAYEGTPLVVETTEEFLEHEFDYVIQSNMNGFRELVDALGGIEVDNPFEFDQGDEIGENTYHYPEGTIELDGERALHYVRMRREDPRGDLGRNERQRQVIEALAERASSFQSIVQANQLLDILGNNVETNMTFDEIQSIYQQYQGAESNMETFELNGESTTENGIYYYDIPEEERRRAIEAFKEHQEQE
ncbi:LCP family glycopolymer transferase [Bacillus sp. FJAT-44742]|uniref:LCP family glycopolymer transferase n=1 Tax=Bacillus sp. FJAT-44742 TaxID=2014005 RepID=UPI000C24E8E7|nr:LCP family protein [Bacillus sp. FJAT-44742]